MNDRLHCETGAAVSWPNGKQYWFWHGVQVPRYLIEQPQEIDVKKIDTESNAEIRRVLMERYGEARYLEDSGAKPIHADQYGTLYRKEIPDDEPLTIVKVTNSTPELDGSRKIYWLRVPPDIQTAHEAVAWTFGTKAKEYHPQQET